MSQIPDQLNFTSGSFDNDNIVRLKRLISLGSYVSVADLETPSALNAGKTAYTSDAGLQVSDGVSWAAVGLVAREAPFATGNIAGTGNVAQAATFLGGTFRGPKMVVVSNGPVSECRFLFRNFNANDTAGPAIYTIGCTVEVGTNQATSLKYPLTFAGKLTTVIDLGGQIWSDPVNIDVIAGDAVYARTFLTIPTVGAGYASTFVSTLGNGEGYDVSQTVPPDNRNSGTITPVGDANAYGPVAALGLVIERPRVLAFGLVGDSIISGVGDEVITQLYRGGWAVRGFNNRVPLYQSSRSGATAVLSVLLYRGRTHLRYCDHVFTAYGVNDIAGSTVAQIQAYWLTAWRSMRAMGPKIWQVTITPVSTSSDGWVTTVNQTVGAANSKRSELNDWLRDGAPLDPAALTAVTSGTASALRAGTYPHPLAGFVELADYVETARNSGIWKAAYTADGTHPTAAGHIAGSATLASLTRFV